MDWPKMTDSEVLRVAIPIMDNLMNASTDIDYERHVRDFCEKLKTELSQQDFEEQCALYQSELGFFSRRELVGIFRRKRDVRVFWRQWYSASDDEFVAFLHLFEKDGKVLIGGVGVS